MTLSDLALSGVQAALSGRTVRYDRLPEHGGSDHIPRKPRTVKEIVLDDNGKYPSPCEAHHWARK